MTEIYRTKDLIDRGAQTDDMVRFPGAEDMIDDYRYSRAWRNDMFLLPEDDNEVAELFEYITQHMNGLTDIPDWKTQRNWVFVIEAFANHLRKVRSNKPEEWEEIVQTLGKDHPAIRMVGEE